MQTVEILREASDKIYQSVAGLAGTANAAGDFGVGAGGDVSRNIDITAEKAVLDHLKEADFGCTILGEECGKVELGDSNGYVIMDAIDGSANAVRGVPFFCSSLAFATEDRLSSITDAVITDLSNGDMYWATHGGGSFLNGKKIHVHDKDPIYKIVGINTSGATSKLMQKMQPIFEQHNHTRHYGPNALEMTFFARGLLDVYVDLRDKIRVQDVAAGYLIAKEAGGLVLDANMKPLDSDLSYQTRLSFIAAANQKILDNVFAGVV